MKNKIKYLDRLLVCFAFLWLITGTAMAQTGTYTVEYNSRGSFNFPQLQAAGQYGTISTTSTADSLGSGGGGPTRPGSFTVGGGGGGGASARISGWAVTASQIPIVVGAGGAVAANGNISSFGGVSVNGGSVGIAGSGTTHQGGPGGAAGVSGMNSTYGTLTTLGTYKGGDGGRNTSTCDHGGGGGSGAGRSAAGNPGGYSFSLLCLGLSGPGGASPDAVLAGLPANLTTFYRFAGPGGNGAYVTVVAQNGQAGGAGGGGFDSAYGSGAGADGRVWVDIAYTYTGPTPVQPVIEGVCQPALTLNVPVSINVPAQNTDITYTWYYSPDNSNTTRANDSIVFRGKGSAGYTYNVTQTGYYYVSARYIDETYIKTVFPNASFVTDLTRYFAGQSVNSDYFNITPGSAEVASAPVRLGLLPVINTPAVQNVSDCNPVAFTSSSLTGNIPATTYYTWSLPTVGGVDASLVTGRTSYTSTAGTSTFSSGILWNYGDVAATITYSVTPKWRDAVTGAECVGAAFDVVLIVPPVRLKVTIPEPTKNWCDGTVDLTTAGWAIGNGTGLRYYTVASGGTAIADPTAVTITDNSYQNFYVEAYDGSSCVSERQLLRVNKGYGTPVVQSYTETVDNCNPAAVTSASFTVTGAPAASVVYSWDTPTVIGGSVIGTLASGSNQAFTSSVFYNNGLTPVVVEYTVVPKTVGTNVTCESVPFSVVITVPPAAVRLIIPDSAPEICQAAVNLNSLASASTGTLSFYGNSMPKAFSNVSAAAPDNTFIFAPVVSGTYTLTTTGAYAYCYIYSDAAMTTLVTSMTTSSSSATAVVTRNIALTAGTTYYVNASAYSTYTTSYVLNVTGPGDVITEISNPSVFSVAANTITNVYVQSVDDDCSSALQAITIKAGNIPVPDIQNLNTTIDSGEEFVGGTIITNYAYTGDVQSVTLQRGIYLLECWGANGGNRMNASYPGGIGGYSQGTLTLAAPQTVYIAVGGFGGSSSATTTTTTINAGGYNGGGGRQGSPAAGGGATHIATMTGTLQEIGVGNQSSLYIVAGGGGSVGATTKAGGNGGGASGQSRTESYGSGGQGGTQSAGGAGGSAGDGTQGSFGQGGTGLYLSSGRGGAGGGGFYGGAGVRPDGSGDDDRGGGGGSGYIDGVTNGVTALSGATGFVANPETTGNGYVRITSTDGEFEGTIPDGTVYSWGVPTILSGSVTGYNTVPVVNSTIFYTGNLINTDAGPAQLRYTVTPSTYAPTSGVYCPGNSFNVTITVNGDVPTTRYIIVNPHIRSTF